MTRRVRRHRLTLAKPVHAPRGIMARYRAELDALIAEHQQQLIRVARRAWSAAPPEAARDATPFESMQRRIRAVQERITDEFNARAQTIAERYVQRTFRWADKRLKRNLLDGGMPVVQYQMTDAYKDALAASIAENVSLIKSIPAQLHERVGGMVSRAFARGSDWGGLYKELLASFRVTKSRAKLIASDQVAKATGNCVRLRQMEVGIRRAKWLHSGGGKKPRKDHQEANGKIYEVEKGCKISGKYILPGQLINCRCTCRSIIE